jgi:crotonobetainyl-CoA:carnitine CoA-transferase CaiB-like acyl-CoA transferase
VHKGNQGRRPLADTRRRTGEPTVRGFGGDVLWIEPPGGAALRSEPSFPFLCRGKRSVESISTNRARNDGALANALAHVLMTRRADEWEHDLLAAGIACVTVNTDPIEAMVQGDAFGRENGFVVDVVHPTFDAHPRLAPLVQFSRSSTQGPPGVLAGSHTDTLLAEFGYSPEQIRDLRDRKIVA